MIDTKNIFSLGANILLSAIIIHFPPIKMYIYDEYLPMIWSFDFYDLYLNEALVWKLLCSSEHENEQHSPMNVWRSNVLTSSCIM